jgi:hypothetical protein
LLSGFLLLAACDDGRIIPDAWGTTTDAIRMAASSTHDAPTAGVNKELAPLHKVTAKFRSFESAKAAGWSEQITGCMTDRMAGGMGYHYANPKLIDGKVRADEPELLVYAPEKYGRMRLVAVEYIVPFGAWNGEQPPKLFGQSFSRNMAFGVWALHAWVGEINPSGMFSDWNPHVSCAYTIEE